MAAISLFWDTNMAVVTSCENTLYANIHSGLVKGANHARARAKIVSREKTREKNKGLIVA